jgi:hypothetical protein
MTIFPHVTSARLCDVNAQSLAAAQMRAEPRTACGGKIIGFLTDIRQDVTIGATTTFQRRMGSVDWILERKMR